MNTDEHGWERQYKTEIADEHKTEIAEGHGEPSNLYPCSSVFICGFLLFALFFRAGALWLMPGALQTDTDGYRRLAENLVEHGTFGTNDVPTAYRSPLYPLALAGCVALGQWSGAAIAALHVALGAATVALVFLLGRWWGLGRWGAVLAALLIACDPILLAESAQVMTETPATFLAAAGLAALTWADRRPTVCRMALAGVILALGSLCRPTLLLWTVAVGAVWTWNICGLRVPLLRRSSAGRDPPPGTACKQAVAHRMASLAAFALGVVVVLAPWVIRNQIQFGRPIVTTTHGGYTLLLANNPDFYRWLHTGAWGDVWHGDRFNADWNLRRPRDELQADRQAYAEAWQTIKDNPRTFCYACAVRIGRFWSPLPHRLSADETPRGRLARYAVALWYGVEFSLAAFGMCQLSVISYQLSVQSRKRQIPNPPSAFRLPPSPWLWGLLLVACLMAPHVVYWTDMRMRAPVMPVVAVAATIGAFRCFSKKMPLPR